MLLIFTTQFFQIKIIRRAIFLFGRFKNHQKTLSCKTRSSGATIIIETVQNIIALSTSREGIAPNVDDCDLPASNPVEAKGQ